MGMYLGGRKPGARDRPNNRRQRAAVRRTRERLEHVQTSIAVITEYLGNGGHYQGKTHAGKCRKQAHRILFGSMERVAKMSYEDRAKLTVLPPPAKEGTPQRRALEMRISGVPHYQIADELGIEEATVRQWIHRQLERTHAEEVRHADVARQLHLERLDMLLTAQWPKAMQGSTDAASTALKIMERQSKLLGLDAPEKVNIEHRIRQIAVENNLDPDEAVEEARAMMKALPRG